VTYKWWQLVNKPLTPEDREQGVKMHFHLNGFCYHVRELDKMNKHYEVVVTDNFSEIATAFIYNGQRVAEEAVAKALHPAAVLREHMTVITGFAAQEVGKAFLQEKKQVASYVH
jgi:hypothetical protein